MFTRFVNKIGRHFEFALPWGVWGEGVSGLAGACGLDREQFGGEIADGVLGLFAGLAPAGSRERVELRARLAGPDIFADEMSLGDRDI